MKRIIRAIDVVRWLAEGMALVGGTISVAGVGILVIAGAYGVEGWRRYADLLVSTAMGVLLIAAGVIILAHMLGRWLRGLDREEF